MAYIILLFSFLFQFNFHTPEPTIRLLVNVNSAQPECIQEWWRNEKYDERGFYKENLSIENWIVVEIPKREKEKLASLTCVITVTEDRKIEWREDIDPNDPSFISQLDMELIGMPDAWDISNGGLTAFGDTIVVAVI
ncbi:MAG TPA: hypothetical protein VMZ69_06675, partial [Saprospiraceae bacterium]|nr:hypothetical protein [Saprospiraceae bacterium]